MMVAAPKFAPGDRVTFTNDNGVVWPGKTIVSLDEDSDLAKRWGHRYYVTPTDTPWYSLPEDQLTKEEAHASDAQWGAW